VTSNQSGLRPAGRQSFQQRLQWTLSAGLCKRAWQSEIGGPGSSSGSRSPRRCEDRSQFGKLREPAQYVNAFLRAFNVKSFDKTSTSDGVLGSRSGTDLQALWISQSSNHRPSFSYYQPGYEVPGTKILGPAFGILSTSTTLRRANDINTLVYTGVSSNLTPTATTPDRPRGTSIDIANLEALAVNPNDGQVADALNALLLHGTMSTQMRTSIITAMNAITTLT